MTQLAKIPIKRMYQTSDGTKFDTLEEAQYHSRVLEFRTMLGIKIENIE